MGTAATDTKHVLSFGGGVNTVALMIVLLEGHDPVDEAVFADTGAEVPETYAYLKIAKGYLEQRGIPLRILARTVKGRDLYQTALNRRVFPSVIWRWSTRDFKVKPIYAYYKSLSAHVNQYLGIAYDEIERMRDSREPSVTNLYPLVDRKLKRADCISIIERAGLPVPVKSGCYFCPFNSVARWQWLYETHPELYQKALLLEETSKHFPSQRLTDQAFRNQKGLTLRSLSRALDAGQEVTAQCDLASPCGAECMT